MSTTHTPPRTKVELEHRLDQSFSRLERRFEVLDARQLEGPTDPAGWTAKDHLAHLAAWERSMVHLLQGRPRHEGLGVEEAVYMDDGRPIIERISANSDAHFDIHLGYNEVIVART